MQDSILLLQFVAGHYGFMILLGIISYIIGYRLTRRITYDSVWEEVSICVSLGLGLIAHLIFLLGILGVLCPSVVLLAIAACVAGSYPVPLEIARRVLSKLRATRLRAKILFVGASFGLSVPLLVLPLYPPISFDATMYFLASAKVYAQNHGLVLTPNLRLPLLTQLNEMLFTLALLLYDDIAAQIIQLLMLMILAMAIFAFCRRNFSKQAGWWAVAVLLANPLVLWSGSVAYLEICLMLFSAMAAYTFWNWLRSRETHWLILAGVFCGFAASTKYPGLFFPSVFGMVTLYVAVRERKYSYPLILTAATLVIAAPWYIRNYYYTSNPVFPFFPQVFGYSYWSAEDVQGILVAMHSHGVGRSLTALLSVPWHLAFNQNVFVAEATLSPLYFYALPLLTVFTIKDARIRRIVGFALAFTVFWFFSAQILRYILPALPMMSVAAAASLDMLLSWIPFTRKWRGHGIVVAVIFVVLANAGWRYSLTAWQERGPIPVSQEQRDNYLTQSLPSYPLYKLLNDLRGRNYGLYAINNENMAYFVDGLYMGDYFGPVRYTRIFDKLSDGRALYSELKSLGTDYFLVSNPSARVRLPQDSFFQENFKLMYSRGNTLLFDLTGNSVPRDIGIQLLMNPSFESLNEDRPVGWGQVGSPVVDASGHNSYTGSSAVRCTGADNFYQTVRVKPGGLYLLSFEARAAVKGEQTARLQVNWSDARGTFLSTDIQIVTVGTNWNRYETTETAPPLASHAVVYVTGHDSGSGSSVWFDDFSFAETELKSQ